MTDELKWKIRFGGAIGLDVTPGCFVCGGYNHIHDNISAHVATREIGAAIVALIGRGARLDYREFEPDWIQVKVGACREHKSFLEHLVNLTIADGLVTPERLQTVLRWVGTTPAPPRTDAVPPETLASLILAAQEAYAVLTRDGLTNYSPASKAHSALYRAFRKLGVQALPPHYVTNSTGIPILAAVDWAYIIDALDYYADPANGPTICNDDADAIRMLVTRLRKLNVVRELTP